MNKKQSLEIVCSSYVRGWAGGEALYNNFALKVDGTYVYDTINGVFNSAKMCVATKFLMDGKKCKIEISHPEIILKGNEKDVEFFKVAKTLPARKWKIWHHALEIFKSTRDKDKVLEYLQTEAVAEVLSK